LGSRGALAAALACTLLVLRAGSTTGLANVAEGPQGAIRVVAQNSSIRFGEGVDLTLSLEGDADITSVRTYYRPLGTRTITTYGYAEFAPGRKVTARLTIPTAAPTYYPPGVVFEVRHEVADAEGNRIDTEPLTIEYLDPSFTWRRLSKGNLTAIYHDRPATAIEDLLAELARRVPRIESTVGAGASRPGDEYRAVLFNSNAEARRAFPFVSQTATEGHVFAGFAYERYGLFVLDHAAVPGVTHELTHLIFGRATNSPTAKRPAWLNEGMAVYFETGTRSATAASLASAIRNDRLLPLRAMNSIPGRPEQIDVFYPEAGNFVGYLIERHGEERMRALVAALRDGVLPAAAVTAAYGVSLEELEAGWRRDVGARVEPSLPSPTPAPSPMASPTTSAAETAARAPSPTPPGDATSVATGSTPAPPSLTIWWFVAGLIASAAVLAAVYVVQRTRRGGP
jgi:hypothetical protein